MTIGERIKEYRKNRGLTQSQLAERLGITDQAVSKWETGITLPDVTTIVPLSKALGVSTDSILGVENMSADEINKVYEEVHERWQERVNSKAENSAKCDLNYDYYKATSELVKKYPYDMDIALSCATHAENVLVARNKEWLTFSDNEVNEIFSEIELLTSRVYKFSDSLCEKRAAKIILIMACCDMGYFGRAEAESECFKGGWWGDTDYGKVQLIIAEKKPLDCPKNYEDRLEKSRILTSSLTWRSLWEHFDAIENLGRFGDVRIPETVEEYKKYLGVLEAYKGIFKESERLWIKMSTLKYLGSKYCAAGDFDKALDTAEEIGDAAEEYFRCYKDGEKEVFLDREYMFWGDDTDEKVKERLYWRTTFWDILHDDENNPIVTSPRYKAVLERINNLK